MATVAQASRDDAHAYATYELVGTKVQSFRETVDTLHRVLNEQREVVQGRPGSLPLPAAARRVRAHV